MTDFTVVEVDVGGLDLFFELGEARHHGDPIEAGRLKTLEPPPKSDLAGWRDPAWRRNHSDCIALLGYPLNRCLLYAAEDEYWRRYPNSGGVNPDAFRVILDELQAPYAALGSRPGSRDGADPDEVRKYQISRGLNAALRDL